MKRIILLVSMLAGPALADDYVYRDEGVTVRLMQAPCAKASLAAALRKILPESSPKETAVTFNGRDLAACWAPGPGRVVIADEDGDVGVIPMAGFRREPGV